jgi:hypothetical protein
VEWHVLHLKENPWTKSIDKHGHFYKKMLFSLIILLNIYWSGRSARMRILGILEMQSLLRMVEVLGLHCMLEMHDWWNANNDTNARNEEKLGMLWIREILMLEGNPWNAGIAGYANTARNNANARSKGTLGLLGIRDCLKRRNLLGMLGNVRAGNTRTVGMLMMLGFMNDENAMSIFCSVSSLLTCSPGPEYPGFSSRTVK